jgi:hypothetical protein
MEVLNSMSEAFSYRILDDYKKSKGYLKINKRQQLCSVEVLKFLLLHGVNKVRRRDIRGEFIGDRENWSRPAILIKGRLVRPPFPLSDSELQHILEKLIVEGYVKKEMVCPVSKRTKDRRQMDAYYHVSLVHLIDEDWLEGEVLKVFRDIMITKLKKENLKGVREQVSKRSLARSELRRFGVTNTSDDDLDTWLNNAAFNH